MEKVLNFHHERWTVQVILDEDAALLGAARRGVRLELGLVREGSR